MERGMEEYLPLNEVNTVLSPTAIQDVEDILFWHYDCFRSEDLINILTAVLNVYIRAKPDPERYPPVSDVAEMILQVVNLNDRLTRLLVSEQVSGWVSRGKDWRKPIHQVAVKSPAY
jgi:hypothetical protein